MTKVFTIFVLFAVVTLLTASAATWRSRDTRETLAGISDLCFSDSLYGWACCGGETLLSTTDGGKRWSTLNSDSLRSKLQGADFVHVTFSNRHVGLITTNFYSDTGDGNFRPYYLKTTNGGATWRLVGLPNADNFALMFFDSSTVCILSDSGRLLFSVNDSVWRTVKLPTHLHTREALFLDHERMVVSCDSGTIFASSDGGSSWSQSALTGFDSVTQAHFENLLRVGYDKVVALEKISTKAATFLQIGYSSDGGHNWSQVFSDPFSYDNFANAGTMAFIDSSFGVLIHQGFVYQTTGDPSQWQYVAIAVDSFSQLPPNIISSGKKLWAVSPFSTFQVSLDSGLSWSDYDKDILHVSPISAIALKRPADQLLCGNEYSAGNFFMESNDGGLIWRPSAGNLGTFASTPGTFIYDVHAFDSSYLTADLYIFDCQTTHVVSHDGGMTWLTDENIPGYFQGVERYDKLHWWTVTNAPLCQTFNESGNADSIMYTSDGGAHWVLQSIATAQLQLLGGAFTGKSFRFVFLDSNNVWLFGNSNWYYQTSDRGQHWIHKVLPWGGIDSLSAGSVGLPPPDAHFVSPAIGLLLGYADNTRQTNALWQTIDSGTHWTKIRDLENVGYNASTYLSGNLFVHPPDYWAIATNGWIWHSTNYGATWSKDSLPGLPAYMQNAPMRGWFLKNDSTLCAYGDAGIILEQSLNSPATFVNHSIIISPTQSQGQFDIAIFPNPVTSSAIVNVHSDQTDLLSLRVFDVFGRMVSQLADREPIVEGARTFPFNAGGIPNGEYLCVARTSKSVCSRLFSIAH